MLYLIDNKNIYDPSINLALEEYCVRNLDMTSNYLLFYINEPSVIIGKHQNTIEEINSEYVDKNKIHVIRRISGGGAVYHDKGNLNFSFMTRHSQQSIHNFKLFTEPVIKVLNELGIKAELNGRNDITVGGRKISGNAQFTDTRSMFSHGTLLFDSNLENVVKALNVKSDKFESKGIKSVRSRVANIKEFLTAGISIDEFKKILIESIFPEEGALPLFQLSDTQWEEVKELSRTKYKTWKWNYGRSPGFNLQKVKRFSFGQIDVRIHVSDGIITDIKIYGDFLGHGDISEIENNLRGVNYNRTDINAVIEKFDLTFYFGDLGSEELLGLMTQ